MNLQESIAQRMMIGLQGDRFFDLLSAGVTGLVAFQPDFANQTPEQVALRLSMFQSSRSPHLPLLWIALDQEGGPVERLSDLLVPSLPSPHSMTLASHAKDFVTRAYAQQSQALFALGFNLNFCPTLDVNTEPWNPVIGVRSFSANASEVSELGITAANALLSNGITPVMKHFPGHGGTSLDSHKALPSQNLTPTHLTPFIAGIQNSLPIIMLSHVNYPGICETSQTPASLSPNVIQKLLRQQLGFSGVLMTDDLQMGAITGDPTETAIRAFEAGVDILLYREAGEREWLVLQALEAALQSGRLSIEEHQASLDRIQAAKSGLNIATVSNRTLPPSYQQLSVQLAFECLQQRRPPVFNRSQPLLLIHPDVAYLPQYAWSTSSDTFPRYLKHAGFEVVEQLYIPEQLIPLSQSYSGMTQALFIASHPCSDLYQQSVWGQLQQHTLTCLQASIYWPSDDPEIILMPSYRPSGIQAFVNWLVSA